MAQVGVFGCLPVAVLCLVAVLFSSFFPYWMESVSAGKWTLAWTHSLCARRVVWVELA